MRATLIAILLVVAVVAWFSMSWSADAASARERFEQQPPVVATPVTTPDATVAVATPTPDATVAVATPADAGPALTSAVMETYKSLYGRYPPTEYLTAYLALAPNGVSQPDILARVRNDGGAPPGVAAPSAAAQQTLAAMPAPPVPTQPILPAAMKQPQDAALPARIMSIATQLSALSEELQAAQAAGAVAPKPFESFLSFRG